MTALTVPLCIDLDGTLTSTDTLHESLLALIRKNPATLLHLPFWICKGKARTKHAISAQIELDPTMLPYNQALLSWLRGQRAQGRKLVLVTAANEKIAAAVAHHLDLFDLVLASDEHTNLSGIAKRQALVNHFGEKGFDYAGNDYCDIPVWQSAREAIVVGGDSLIAKARQVAAIGATFSPSSGSLRAWLKAMRPHQWAKNALIFLPMILAHRFVEPAVLEASLLAFAAFSLCASSIYIINDLFDLNSDRHHPRKRLRPFASGTLPVSRGILVALGLFCISVAITTTLPWKFAVVLGSYYLLTWAYSITLKRIPLLDVITLACLYTSRIAAGATATAIQLSFWLLAFSVFIFLSLAFVKRYTEILDATQSGKPVNRDRGYRSADLPLLLTLGTAAGYCMVVVMALYLYSVDSQALYSHHKPLWAICPILLYWISRVWLLTTRGEMHDDPIVFALRDRTSLGLVVILAVIFAIAM